MRDFIVLDLETTGLTPGTDVVLEICAIHINMQTLEELGRFQQVAGMSKEELNALNMHPAVFEMHEINGLFHEVISAPPCNQIMLDVALLQWLEGGVSSSPGSVFLCGNSIHFDRGFLEYWMPLSFKYLSHRMVDTSSFLTCYVEWCGEKPRFVSGHRAISDCEASLETLRWFRSLMQAGDAALKTVTATKESEHQP